MSMYSLCYAYQFNFLSSSVNGDVGHDKHRLMDESALNQSHLSHIAPAK